MSMLRPLLLAAACAAALPAIAADHCDHAREENPRVDLAGVTRVEVSIGADRFDLKPLATGGAPSLRVRHCASNPELLAESRMTVERDGSVLRLRSETLGVQVFNLFGSDRYSWRDIALVLPAGRSIALAVGSGDASVASMDGIEVDVGSGDVRLLDVGAVTAEVGSGDLVVEGAVSANVVVGSGDATLRRVDGNGRATVGSGDVAFDGVASVDRLSVGSGDITARAVRGDVGGIDVGSGDVILEGVGGSVAISDVGSGAVVAREVGGDVRVRRVGSGDVRLDGVRGDVIVSDEDTLESVSHRAVDGRIIVGG